MGGKSASGGQPGRARCDQATWSRNGVVGSVNVGGWEEEDQPPPESARPTGSGGGPHGTKLQAWVQSPWACVQPVATSWLGDHSLGHPRGCPSLYIGAFPLPVDGWMIPSGLLSASLTLKCSVSDLHTPAHGQTRLPLLLQAPQLPPTHHDHSQALTLCHMVYGQ